MDPLGGGDCGSGYVGGRSSIRVIGRMWIVCVVVWILHIRTSREGDVESWERVEVVGRTVVGGGGGCLFNLRYLRNLCLPHLTTIDLFEHVGKDFVLNGLEDEQI